jgi:hypothetical protein
MTATIALAAWTLNTVIGLVMLLRLLNARRQVPPLAYYHLVTALVGLGFWIGFMAVGSAVLAWLGFAVLFLHNTFGDRLRVRGWQKRNPATQKNVYFKSMMAAMRRPLTAVHAILAGVTFFPALAAAVISSWGA